VSTYEDYADASTHYDATRIPVGVEIILGLLASGPIPPAEARMLDAGCGTGSFAAALASHVGHLTMLDASAEMLAEAELKLADTPDAAPVDAHQGTLQALPFEDASFDAVMTNQVLHHLGDRAGSGWPEHGRAFAEYSRVLRPGGLLVVHTCSHEQIRHGFWAFSFVPEATDEMCRRYAPLEVLEALAEDHGLAPAGRFVPVHSTIQGDSYFDPEAPLSAEWRRADSTWSLASDDELEAMVATLTDLRQQGELGARMAELDARRPAIGQVTFVASRKPLG
jgi:SAM-dependent methyltransferase